HNQRGDGLDPEIQLLLALEYGLHPTWREPTVEEARAALVSNARIVEGPRRELARVEDLAGGPVPLRLYVPPGAERAPVLVYAHGGGWAAGDLRSHDRTCRRLAADGGQIVVAVAYGRAPEHPYPAGLRDLVAAFRWVRGHADSFGGNP